MKNETVSNILTQVKAWILRHEIISSCIFALLLGLAIGGVTVVLEWMFV